MKEKFSSTILQSEALSKYLLETSAYPREHEQLKEIKKVVAVDPDREAYEIGLPFIEKAGVADKIQFLNSDGITALNKLLDSGEEGTFDFAFVDADKANYINYHELVLKLVKVGGIIAYDNTLWFGTVAMSDEDLMGLGPERAERYRPNIDYLKHFNPSLAADSRIDLAHLSDGDGIAICRRLK